MNANSELKRGGASELMRDLLGPEALLGRLYRAERKAAEGATGSAVGVSRVVNALTSEA